VAGAEGTPMQELRFVAVSEDGRYAVLAVPGRSARFTLPIDERLRAVALGQTSRLAQYEIEVESPLRPKEIQARIRAGETVEEIADAAGIAVERVRWFEGPVLAERAYIAEQAQAASVRRPGESAPGPRLGEITAERLSAAGADPDDVQWDARKRGDGNWQVQLTFTSGGRLHVAEWLFDPRRRHVIPSDDNAARMSLPGTELPQPAAPGHGEATVTRLAPRLRQEAPVPPKPPVAEPPEPLTAAEPVPPAQPVAPPAPAPVPAPAAASAPAPAAASASAAAAAAAAAASTESPAPREVPVEREVPAAREVAASREVPAAREVAASREVPASRNGAASPEAPASRNGAASPKAPAASTEAPASRDVASQTTDPAARPSAPSQPAAADNAGEQLRRQGRKSARGRRSSVPSWDEIMLGSSRERD
jgi:hypothetical protein